MPKPQSKSKKPTAADRADPYDCYGRSVQDPAHEVELFERIYRELSSNRPRKSAARQPRRLREDFCGTFAVCSEWVASKRTREAVGVDLDPEPVAWGREHHFADLTSAQQSRLHLHRADVCDLLDSDTSGGGGEGWADILAAQNFSFWTFQTRDALGHYFRTAHAHLAPGGVMVLDMMGGGDCYTVDHEDYREVSPATSPRRVGFTYVWEQHAFNPITRDATFHIHFRFRDGSELDRAFTYDWRFWTIPEVRELLTEAGFTSTHVLWEGTDEDTGDGDGEWHVTEEGTPDPSWIAYIVGVK